MLLLVGFVSLVALGGPWFADMVAAEQVRAGLARLISPESSSAENVAAGGVPAGTTDMSVGEAVVPSVPAAQLPPADERTFPVPGFEEAPAPLGEPSVTSGTDGSYALSVEQTGPDGEKQPVAWSPCRPIHVVTDPDGAPDGFGTQLHAILDEVSAATGLRFVVDGLTVEAADIDRAPFLPARYGDRWAPVLVRFANETEIALLAGDVAGVASPTHVTDPTTGRAHFVTGVVYLDRELLQAPAADGGDAVYVEVLRHEIGHLVGLGHVSDPSQAMYPSTGGVRAFQPGDLAGLAVLGRGPCAPGL